MARPRKIIELSSIAEEVGIDTKTARRRLRAFAQQHKDRMPKSITENRWRFTAGDRSRVVQIISD